MAKDLDTIIGDSKVGKRLARIHKTEEFHVSCNGEHYPLTAQITVGRGSDNVITLEDNLVSRHHAVIQKIKDGYYIKDMDSKNGTTVNGTAVPLSKYIKLESGDVISIGRTELKVT